MNKSVIIYLVLFLVVSIGIIALDSNTPKPINWTPTYSINDKIPFGLYIFNNELHSLLKPDTLNTINVTAYEYFDGFYNYDTLVNKYETSGTFIAINDFADIDEESVKELLYFSGHGNSVFLSMKSLPQMLVDSLKFDFSSDFEISNNTAVWFANEKLGAEKYNLVEGLGSNYFSKIDTINTTVLGYQGTNKAFANFIKVPYKQGTFYLHLQPAAFTNFHLLKNNHSEYAEKVLSYVPKGNIYWYTKGLTDGHISQNPMRFLFSQPALKAAWYLFLFGMLVFIFFNVKRKQRIVPIVEPLENTTIEFTKTIGNLYFQEGNHHTIIDKKIIYLLDKIRRDYLLDTTVLDDKFVQKLQHKTGKNLEDLKQLCYKINQHRKGNYESVENDLVEINTLIEKIFS
ncbi:hypothetical protein FLAN108750_11125 [Flavobacterium antarcticum]|uniref:hypothetical protein n=1 Tax=Flavobacterium antarcticum TaxID=271155 RepID=UPI0003B36668|nr:hypothetical protein [Flavobacterium antarcticum]